MAWDWLSALSLRGIVSPGDETDVDLMERKQPLADVNILNHIKTSLYDETECYTIKK